ncbi:MAG TPA: hypothetical protein VGM64_10800 [Lacunisphaera sp.]|jgi:hypothetical protein
MQTLIQKQKNILTVAMVAALSVSVPRLRAEGKEKSTKSAKVELAQLQLKVGVPRHWRPFLSNDLAGAFASRLAEVFRREGYRGEIAFLDGNTANPDAPVLGVELTNWRVNQTEHAECSFTASLKYEGQEHKIGEFENDRLVWNDRFGRWGLADALGDAADGALRELSGKLGSLGILGGFPVSAG